jgi:hypothetical protein
MKQTLLAIVVALSGVLPQAPQGPQAPQAQVWWYGPADTSCGSWAAHRKDPSAILGVAEKAWVEGFLNGSAWTAQALNIEFKRTDPDAIFVRMDKYCADHPLDNLAQGATSVALELRVQR